MKIGPCKSFLAFIFLYGKLYANGIEAIFQSDNCHVFLFFALAGLTVAFAIGFGLKNLYDRVEYQLSKKLILKTEDRCCLSEMAPYEKNLQAQGNTCDGLYWVIDRNSNNIVRMSNSFERLFQNQTRISTDDIVQIVHPEDVEFYRYMLDRPNCSHFEFRIEDVAGGLYWIRGQHLSLEKDNREETESLIIFEDISTLVNLKNEYNCKKQQRFQTYKQDAWGYSLNKAFFDKYGDLVDFKIIECSDKFAEYLEIDKDCHGKLIKEISRKDIELLINHISEIFHDKRILQNRRFTFNNSIKAEVNRIDNDLFVLMVEKIRTSAIPVEILEESKKRYDFLFNSMFQGIIYQDAAGNIFDSNDAAEEILQTSLKGRNVHEIFTDDVEIYNIAGHKIGKAMLPSQLILQNGKEIQGMVMGIRWPNQKEIIWIKLNARSTICNKSKQKLISISFTDISSERRSQKQLRKLAAAIEQASDGIAIIDTDGVIEFANSEWAKMHNIDRDKVEGMLLSNFFTSDEYDNSFLPLFDEVIEKYSSQGAMYQKRIDGTTFPVNITMTFINDSESCSPTIVIMSRDQTESLKIDAEKKMFQRRLKQAQKLETIGTLAGGIAHDFNNILTPIIGYSELCLLDIEKESLLYSNFEHVLKSAYRAKDLVSQIMTFSRSDEWDKRPIEIHIIINEALKLIESSIPSTIKIRKFIDNRAGKVLADPTKIHQMFLNICTNAYQAMPDGGIMTVELQRVEKHNPIIEKNPNIDSEKGFILLRISDTGVGMESEVQEHAFEPFFTTRDPGEGYGLGLSVIHGICTALEGDVWLDSDKNSGTSVNVLLPKYDNNAQLNIAQNPIFPLGNQRIMIIDDEKEIAVLTKTLLERFGYSADCYVDGNKAIYDFKTKKHKWDLIITDQTMPKITGMKLASKIRKIAPDFPIILMSGYQDKKDDVEFDESRINFFVDKPLTLDNLGEAIRKALGLFPTELRKTS